MSNYAPPYFTHPSGVWFHRDAGLSRNWRMALCPSMKTTMERRA